MQDKEVLDYIKQAFELKEQGCFKQAIEMLYKTLECDVDNAEILFQLGDLYFQLHNYVRAEKYLEKVLLKNPRHIDSYKLLKEICIRENNLQNAKTIAEKIYTLDGSSKNLANLINILAQLKEFGEIEKYVSGNLSDAYVMVEYANCCRQKGDLEHALEILAQISEESDDAQILKGKIYFDNGDMQKSREIFQKLERITENDEVLNYLGLFAMEDERFTDAVKYFSKASSMNKNKSVYFYNLGNAYFLNGWIEEAVSAYKKAIGLDVDNCDYRYSLCYLYFRQKDFEKAQNEVKFILENNPNHSQTKVLDALLKFEFNDYLGAEKILEENLKNSPDDAFTKSALAKVYSELLNLDKAEKILEELTALFPQNLAYKCDFANVYIKEKRFDDALSLLENVISENENYLDAYILAAGAAFQKGDLEKTKEFSQNAIALDVNCSKGYCWLSKVRSSEGDFEEAVECMKRAIFYDINNPLYYAEMSGLYKEKGDFKTAFEYIKEAETLDNKNSEYKIIYKELAAKNRKA